MSQTVVTPQLVANLLVAAFAALEVLRWRRAGTMTSRVDRGTTLVFWGCYAIALLALNTTIPSPITTTPQVTWGAVVAASCGLAARIGAALVAGTPGRAPAPLRAWAAHPYLDSFSSVAIWVGATAASGNLIATLTVAVAMLAAIGVRSSEQRGPGADPRLEGR